MAFFSPSSFYYIRRSEPHADASMSTAEYDALVRNEAMDSTLSQALARQQASADRASAILLEACSRVERKGKFELEQSSVYGAAILVPQLARTTKWPTRLVTLSARVYMFLIVNLTIQFYLLQSIAREAEVMNLFSDAVYLCNFAKGQRGPGGTEVTAASTYPWTQWHTRRFFRDSLQAILPNQTEEIAESVDIGEYALESYIARWVCCYLFILTTTPELLTIVSNLRMLWAIPSASERWVTIAEDGNLQGVRWLDRVDIRIAGMPRLWKLINLVCILVPKMILFMLCTQVGIGYLMDTAGVEDLIINSVALGFILNIDEMICSVLMSNETRELLQKCEPWELYDPGEPSDDAEIKERFEHNRQWSNFRCSHLHKIVPWKLALSLLLTVFFIMDWYRRHCIFVDGNLVSKTMYAPLSTDFGFLQTILPGLLNGGHEEKPYWTMPPRD